MHTQKANKSNSKQPDEVDLFPDLLHWNTVNCPVLGFDACSVGRLASFSHSLSSISQCILAYNGWTWFLCSSLCFWICLILICWFLSLRNWLVVLKLSLQLPSCFSGTDIIIGKDLEEQWKYWHLLPALYSTAVWEHAKFNLVRSLLPASG